MEKKKKQDYLRVRDNVVVIMAKTTRAAHKLAEESVAEMVSAPTIWVPPFHLLCLFPALLLHTVWKTSRVRVWATGFFRRDLQASKQIEVLCDNFAV